MSGRFLKVQAFVVGLTVSIAMLLFAAQRRDSGVVLQYRAVIDLTGTGTTTVANGSSQSAAMIAPAKLGGSWTLETIPTNHLVAPLAVIEAEHKNFSGSESLVTMDDVAEYERLHGAIPQRAVVLISSVKENVTPSLNDDALHFLAQARNIVGVGSASSQTVSLNENTYLAENDIYELSNVANVSLVPKSGAIVIVAPQKTAGASEAPVRLMAIVR